MNRNMTITGFDPKILRQMAYDPIDNYAIPGLRSSLIGKGERGTVRLFECERDHQEAITPHSHRYDFHCVVLEGHVTNRIWQPIPHSSPDGDPFTTTRLIYRGEVGDYTKQVLAVGWWKYADTVYEAGQCYSMDDDEVHSIYFSRGAKVLFFQGPNIKDTSIIIEPCVRGQHIETFKVEPWMFQTT